MTDNGKRSRLSLTASDPSIRVMRVLLLPLALLVFAGCSEEDTTNLPVGTTGRDAAAGRDARGHMIDVGVRDDADPGPVDVGGFEDAIVDAGFHDAGFHDSGLRDSGFEDGGVRDATHHADATGGHHDASADAGHDAGAGAACPPAHRRPAPECPATGICGNGVRNRCTVCTGGRLARPPPDAGPICVEHEEECDTQDLGGQSCASLGFASGQLGCGVWCGFETSRCNVCETHQQILGCRTLPIGETDVRDVAIATNGADIAVAYANASGVSFLLYDLRLNLIGQAPCVHTHATGTVAVAAVPGGWVLAAGGNQGVTFYALDGMGRARSQPHTTPGRDPILVERPGAGPLLVWTDGNSTQAALLDNHAIAQWQIPVLTGVVGSEFVTGVWTGTRFLIAGRTNGIQIVAVEATGMTSGQTSPTGGSTEYPELAWGSTDGRLIWTDFGSNGAVNWQRIDGMGNTTGTAVAVASRPTYFNNAPAVVLGNGDTALLLGRFTGGTGVHDGLDLMRVDGAGQTVTAPLSIERDPNPARRHRLLHAGTTVYAAWVGEGYPGRVGVAELQP